MGVCNNKCWADAGSLGVMGGDDDEDGNGMDTNKTGEKGRGGGRNK